MFFFALQLYPGTSIEGPIIDRFYKSGAGYQYIALRNLNGAGDSYLYTLQAINL